jgi:hypothetical protein
MAIYNDNQYQHVRLFKADSTTLQPVAGPAFLVTVASAKSSANRCQTERRATWRLDEVEEWLNGRERVARPKVGTS